MTKDPSFDAEQRRLQAAWFAENLAPKHGYGGAAYRLPPESRHLNLAPAIRDAAERLFSAEPSIQWHQHANHGLSSQVCCVNFLMPFADKPEVLRRWLEHVTGDHVVEMLPVETNRAGQPWYVTFEWIGDTDHLHEGREGALRKRGANATAADAAVAYRDAEGRRNLVLVEWKYTERYGQPRSPERNPTRRQRYEEIFRFLHGPIRADADVTLDDFFYEPFYQMLRQQMLAWHTEAKDPGIDRVRVLHLAPAGNRALHAVTSPGLRKFGVDAFEVFRSLLQVPDDFVSMSIEAAFAPLADWPDADWYPWLRGRYSSLCTVPEARA
ncbi:MAG: hypothetical protein J0H08_17760 [Rhizobiales bacterium]|nr:hypothetical protein [Hyphomicrobiales bacterium]